MIAASVPIPATSNTTTYRCLQCRVAGTMTYPLHPVDTITGMHYRAAMLAAEKTHQILSPGCPRDQLRVCLQAPISTPNHTL